MATATKPYSGPDDPALPPRIQKLDADKRSTWIRTFNAVLKKTDNEGQAMALANTAIKMKELADDLRDDPEDEMRDKAAPTKTEGDVDFQASDYADVPDPQKASTWKLRLAETPGKFTVAQVARAITALQPGGFRGQQVAIGTSKDQVVAKINAAIGKTEGDDAQKKNLRDRLGKVKDAADLHGHGLGEKCDKCEDMPAMPAMMPMPSPLGGATSFAELDAWQATVTLNDQISDVAYQFRALTDNIMGDMMMSAEEKAGALSNLAGEFQRRVRTLPPEQKAALGALREKTGRRMGAPQLDMMRKAFDALKSLVSWGSYDEAEEDDEEAKDLEAVDLNRHSGFKVYAGPDGVVRWLTYSSNAYEDVEGELFTTKALEDAVTWADAAGERGPLRLFHVPGADIGHCDFQSVVGRFLVESGTFAETAIGQRARDYFEAHKDIDHGVSIGFIYKLGDEADGVYDWLRIRERSITPPGTAANPFTRFEIGGPLMLDPRKKAFLEDVLGVEHAAAVIADAEARSKALDASGLKYKAGEADQSKTEADAAAQAAAAAATAAAATAAGDTKEPPDESEGNKELLAILSGIKEAVSGLPGLITRVKAIEEDIIALKQTDDEKVAALMRPRTVIASSADRPTEKASNLLTDEQAIKEIVGAKEGEEASPASPYAMDFLRQVGVLVKN